MNWILLSISSMFFFTALNLLQRVLAVKTKNARAMALIFNATASALSLCIFLLSGSYKDTSLPKTLEPYLYLAIASLFYGLYERFRFKIAYLIDSSTLTVIGSSSTLVAFLGSIVLYKENLTFQNIAGGIIIILSLVLVSYSKDHKKTSMVGIFTGIVVSSLLGIGWMLDKKGTVFFTADVYNVLVWFLPLLVVAFPKIDFISIKEEIIRASFWKIALLASFNVIAYFLQLKAMEIADSSRVITIVQTSTIFTIICGVIILKERENIKRKFMAGFMVLVGIALVVQ
jgi:drug/metabolite transporter (DMT)-like permease